MSPEPGTPPKVAANDLTEAAAGTSRLDESCVSLLEDFPDPVLIADRHQKVVFLNRAAEKIFGASLGVGDPCPICSQLTGLPLSADEKRLIFYENAQRVLALKAS